MSSPLGIAVMQMQPQSKEARMRVIKNHLGRTQTFTKEGSEVETCIRTGKPVAQQAVAPYPWRMDEKKPALAEEQKKAQEAGVPKAPPTLQIGEHAFVSE